MISGCITKPNITPKRIQSFVGTTNIMGLNIAINKVNILPIKKPTIKMFGEFLKCPKTTARNKINAIKKPNCLFKFFKFSVLINYYLCKELI